MYNEYEDEEEVEEKPSKGVAADFYNNNKKLVWLVIGIIIFIIALKLFSGGGSSSAENKVTIYSDSKEVSEIIVSVGNVSPLTAKVNGKSGTFKWSEGDKNIATVDESGRVRGIAVGETEVVAIYNDSDRASCLVKVVKGNPNIKLESAGFPDGDLFMGVNTQYSLDIVAKPSNGYISSRTFQSSDTSVVTVDDSGIVKAIRKGSAKISVKVNDDLTDDIMVYVNESITTSNLLVSVQNIKFQNAIEKIELGKQTQLKFDTEPANADLNSVFWKSSNEAIVKADEKTGVLTGVAIGTALVKAYSLTGNEVALITVEVVESLTEVTSVSAPYPSITMAAGSTQTIKPTVKPDNASSKGLTYTSSNPAVATVTTNDGGITGVINAISSGTAVITITSTNNKTATITVTVNSSGGSSSGGGTSYDPHDDKGYVPSSKDADGKGIVCRNYEYTSKTENIGRGPVTITFNINSSSTTSLKVCKYKYGNSSCNPDSDSNAEEIKKGAANNFIRINETGVWVIVVSEYNGTSRKNTLKWYARVDSISSNPTASGGDGGGTQQQVSCCYKNAYGKFSYGLIDESSCYDKTLSQDACLDKNQESGDTYTTCCYRNSSGVYTYGNVRESQCVNRTDNSQQCQNRNNQYSDDDDDYAILLNYYEYTLEVNETVKLEAFSSGYSNFTWSSSNTQVATVSSTSGASTVVTAKNASSTPVKIIATAPDGKTVECSITVVNSSNGSIVINSVDYSAGYWLRVGDYLGVTIGTSTYYNRIYFCTGSCSLSQSSVASATSLDPYAYLFNGYLKPDSGVIYYYEFAQTKDKTFYFDFDINTTIKFAAAFHNGRSVQDFSSVKTHTFTGNEND